MRYTILSLSLLLTATLRMLAQPYCDVRSFSMRDGLAANIVSGFTQTNDGLMWFATWNGLCFYDGNKFTTFRSNGDNDGVLTTNRIILCRPSATGSLWCITPDGHAYFFDTKRSLFVSINDAINKKTGRDIYVEDIYPMPNGHTWIVSNDNTVCCRVDDRSVESDNCALELYGTKQGNLKSDVVKKVEADEKGREWIFTDKGVQQPGRPLACRGTVEHMATAGGQLFFATSDGQVFRYAETDKTVKVMTTGRVSGMKVVGGNTLALATDNGVAVYGPLAGTAKGIRTVSVQSPGQPMPEVTDLFVDTKKRLWVFTKADGVVLIDSRTWQTQWLMASAASVTEQTTSQSPFFHEDANGTVWVVPRGGTLCYYCESESHLTPYRLASPDHPGMCLTMINKHFEDKDHNLWFTANPTNHGASFLNFKYHHFRFLPVMANEDARSVYVDGEGRTWIGMYEGKVVVYDRNNQLLGYLNRKGQLQSAPTAFASRIYAIRDGGNGTMWIGTKGQGLFAVERNGTVRQYRHSANDKYSLNNDDIYDIDTDRRGNVWVATFGGGLNLMRRDSKGNVAFFNANNSLSQYPLKDCYKIRRITHNDKGEVILSTTNGLVTFSDSFTAPEKIRFFVNQHKRGDAKGLMGADVLQTLVTHDGRVLVATLGGSVQQVEQKSLLSDKLTFNTLGDNSTNGDGTVQSLLEDNGGNVWAVSGSTLICYIHDGKETLQYVPNTTNGYVELSEAMPAYNAKDDMIAMCVRGGVVTFSPKKLPKSANKPKIVFTSVLYQGEQAMEPVLGRDVLDVPSSRRNLTVYFSALEYGDRYFMKYAYKIDDIDDEWNYIGANNSVSFNNLPAGRHRLLVKSTNADGMWVDNVTTLNIYAHPTFWETGWAWLLYAVILAALVFVAAYIYTLRAKNVMTREMSEMKMKFFTEIGHKLRTPLTLIGGPVTEVLESQELKETAKSHLLMVKRNATQMLDLVNKMLRYDGNDDTYISDDNAAMQGVTTTHDNDSRQGLASYISLKLLVVEDNDDLRAYLLGILSDDYTVLQAANGKEGLDIAEREMPDFIITDVMMPVMDGLTMVHLIKQNNNICHIPIIVLSAKASLDDRLQGLKEGIDDYITKPFSSVYLKSRVSNIISSRRALQQAYIEQIKPEDKKTYKLESPQIVDADNEMMKRLLSFLEKNIGDSSLRIEDCADAVNLGRSVFYGKIKSIVGMSPIDFVRHIRMQRAKELIAKSDYPLSQVAYMVGFSDPKYFSKCFKKDMGMTPTEYREKAVKGDVDGNEKA